MKLKEIPLFCLLKVVEFLLHVAVYLCADVLLAVIVSVKGLLTGQQGDGQSRHYDLSSLSRSSRSPARAIIVVSKNYNNTTNVDIVYGGKGDDDEVDAMECFGFHRSSNSISSSASSPLPAAAGASFPASYYVDEFYTGAILNGHIHTVLGSLRTQQYVPIVRYSRETVRSLHDSARLCIDWHYASGRARHRGETQSSNANNSTSDSSDESAVSLSAETAEQPSPRNLLPPANGVIVVFPGLSSDSKSVHIQSMTYHAARRGYHVAVAIKRGLGGAPLDTPLLAAGAYLGDFEDLFNEYFSERAMEERFGLIDLRVSRGGATTVFRRPLPVFAVGQSLGGATLCRYLSTVREATPLVAAAALCSPWDFNGSSETMVGMRQKFYMPILGRSITKILRRHTDILRTHPDRQVHDTINRIQNGYTLKSVGDFDTSIVAPMHGYASMRDYYTDCSPLKSMHQIEIPLLCMTAADDVIVGRYPPMARWQQLTRANPNILYVSAPAGGHLGFLDDPISTVLQERANWMVERVIRAFDSARVYQYRRDRPRDVPETLPVL